VPVASTLDTIVSVISGPMLVVKEESEEVENIQKYGV
jgi:uncharacterized protein YlzI (FlbEa/FlbD family)